MKIKLAVSRERYAEVERLLTQRGITVDADGDFVLTENNRYPDRLMVRDGDSGERVVLPVEDIVLIEAFGHSLSVRTLGKSYGVSQRLYKILGMLEPEKFLRISNSVVIAKDKVTSISPTFSMKFVLTMANGQKVDVTRSYYYLFKESFGI
ncbi:MAG TPA: LytTR family transcriptional regulator [Candidatus Faecousia excrementigallinarum]|uniref:LytTR family transcriptional regulator n=1 Tax=Candidatus Faecousia excrementigallinarum TaxID=2840806 RepID=A0A9D1CLD4_9FIRM|nr:LytTR family transcriptional regulator [Candidatus Faecousia excrementigallinarum]